MYTSLSKNVNSEYWKNIAHEALSDNCSLKYEIAFAVHISCVEKCSKFYKRMCGLINTFVTQKFFILMVYIFSILQAQRAKKLQTTAKLTSSFSPWRYFAFEENDGDYVSKDSQIELLQYFPLWRKLWSFSYRTMKISTLICAEFTDN